jgi:hypothetical protein
VKAGNRKINPIVKQIHINGLIGGASGSWAYKASAGTKPNWAASLTGVRGAYRGGIARKLAGDRALILMHAHGRHKMKYRRQWLSA